MLKNISFSKMFIFLLFSLSFFLLLSFLGLYSAIRPFKFVSKNIPRDLGLEFEKVSFTTSDNIKLSGWFIPHQNQKQAKTIIFLHGYPADKGNILPSIAFLNKKYNLFLFDFRHMGESEGRISTAGAREVKDLLAAIDFLKQKDINEVGVWGFSMGGAVALMASSQAPEIKAIISEASYASLDKMTYELYGLPILKYPLGWLTSVWAKIILGINAYEVSPAKSAQSLRIPILIIHSRNDNVIAFSNAKIIQEALKDNTNAEFWFKDRLIHGQLGEEYQKYLEDFFDKNL